MSPWGLVLALLLAEACPGYSHLRLPASLGGDPPLVVDPQFSFTQAGQTGLELVLGGPFTGMSLPKGATRAPRFSVSIELHPEEGQGPAVAKGGIADLAQVLESKGLRFDPSLFTRPGALHWQAVVPFRLAPGRWKALFRVEDPELGFLNEKSLALSVPTLKPGPGLALGDLRILDELWSQEGRPAFTQNLFRTLAGASAKPLLALYDLRVPKSLRSGRLHHRFSIHALDPQGELGEKAWQAEEWRNAPGTGASLESLQVPDDALARLAPGLWALQVLVARGPAKAQGAALSQKAFEIPAGRTERRGP